MLVAVLGISEPSTPPWTSPRGGAEVERRVAAKVGGGVGRRDLVILLSAKVSTKLSETLDDAAPMTTDGLRATRVPAEAVETDMSVESPESRTLWHAVAPLTPPAALMSETARPTPAISGGPRNARSPVSGRMPPTWKQSALL